MKLLLDDTLNMTELALDGLRGRCCSCIAEGGAMEEVSDDCEGERGGDEWDSGMAPKCVDVASSFSRALRDKSLFMVVNSAFLVLSSTISCMISSRDAVKSFV